MLEIRGSDVMFKASAALSNLSKMFGNISANMYQAQTIEQVNKGLAALAQFNDTYDKDVETKPYEITIKPDPLMRPGEYIPGTVLKSFGELDYGDVVADHNKLVQAQLDWIKENVTNRGARQQLTQMVQMESIKHLAQVRQRWEVATDHEARASLVTFTDSVMKSNDPWQMKIAKIQTQVNAMVDAKRMWPEDALAYMQKVTDEVQHSFAYYGALAVADAGGDLAQIEDWINENTPFWEGNPEMRQKIFDEAWDRMTSMNAKRSTIAKGKSQMAYEKAYEEFKHGKIFTYAELDAIPDLLLEDKVKLENSCQTWLSDERKRVTDIKKPILTEIEEALKVGDAERARKILDEGYAKGEWGTNDLDMKHAEEALALLKGGGDEWTKAKLETTSMLIGRPTASAFRAHLQGLLKRFPTDECQKFVAQMETDMGQLETEERRLAEGRQRADATKITAPQYIEEYTRRRYQPGVQVNDLTALRQWMRENTGPSADAPTVPRIGTDKIQMWGADLDREIKRLGSPEYKKWQTEMEAGLKVIFDFFQPDVLDARGNTKAYLEVTGRRDRMLEALQSQAETYEVKDIPALVNLLMDPPRREKVRDALSGKMRPETNVEYYEGLGLPELAPRTEIRPGVEAPGPATPSILEEARKKKPAPTPESLRQEQADRQIVIQFAQYRKQNGKVVFKTNGKQTIAFDETKKQWVVVDQLKAQLYLTAAKRLGF